MIVRVESRFSMYCVFDGHGQKGHDISNFVKENLPKLILKDPRMHQEQMHTEEWPDICKSAFKQVQALIGAASRTGKLNAMMSGTTATVVMHNHEAKKLVIAHVGDSAAVLGAADPDVRAVSLTRDHKPDLRDERARIERAGGRVVFDGYANHRVYAQNGRYPGLNMSRCLGDLLGHADAGLISEPETQVIDLTERDKVLILASDGVWEFLTANEAMGIAGRQDLQPKQAADNLAKESWDRWIREEGGMVVDDICIIVVHL